MLRSGSEFSQHCYLEISEQPIKLGDLVKCISKQSVEVAFWFLLAAYSKMQENKDDIKKELLNKSGNR